MAGVVIPALGGCPSPTIQITAEQQTKAAAPASLSPSPTPRPCTARLVLPPPPPCPYAALPRPRPPLTHLVCTSSWSLNSVRKDLSRLSLDTRNRSRQHWNRYWKVMPAGRRPGAAEQQWRGHQSGKRAGHGAQAARQAAEATVQQAGGQALMQAVCRGAASPGCSPCSPEWSSCAPAMSLNTSRALWDREASTTVALCLLHCSPRPMSMEGMAAGVAERSGRGGG